MIKVGDFSFFTIEAIYVDAAWDRYANFIAVSVDSDTVLVEEQHLRAAAIAGAYQLWGVEKLHTPVGGFLTTTSTLPCGRQMDIEFLGGEKFFEWGPMLWPHFEANAKSQGIDSIRMCGRPGWAKTFKSFGYSPDIVIASKRL